MSKNPNAEWAGISNQHRELFLNTAHQQFRAQPVQVVTANVTLQAMNRQSLLAGESLTVCSHLARMALALVPNAQASFTKVSTDALRFPLSRSETNETAKPDFVAVWFFENPFSDRRSVISFAKFSEILSAMALGFISGF